MFYFQIVLAKVLEGVVILVFSHDDIRKLTLTNCFFSFFIMCLASIFMTCIYQKTVIREVYFYNCDYFFATEAYKCSA